MQAVEYTTALLELALREHKEREVSKDFELLLGLYEEDPNIFKSQKKFESAILGKKISKISKNTVGVVIKAGDQNLIPFIAANYFKLVSKKEFDSLVNVRVKSAVPLDDDQMARIRKALVSKLGKDLAIRYSVDEDILGGLVIQAGDIFMNYSLKRKLELMERSIAQKKHYL